MTFNTDATALTDAYGFAPPTIGGAVGCMYAAVDYTMTTATALFTVPAGAVLIDYYVDIRTAFDDTGTDLLNVGTADTPDGVVDDLAGGTAGVFRAGAGATTPRTDLLTTPLTEDTTYYFSYTGENTNATEGAGYFVLLYILQ